MVAANVPRPPNSPDSCNLSGLFLILGARMPKDSMRIEWWDIDKVVPYENNPRHNDDAVEKVANSLREFGWKQSLVVDSDGVLIVGHTRLKAAKSLGMDKVPVLVANDLTPAQTQAYRLADNKTAELATWDTEALSVELEGLEVDFDMTEFGFDAGIPIDGFGEDFELPDGDGPEFKTISLHLTQEQFDRIASACGGIDRDTVRMSGGNEYGDKVCEIVCQWEER